MTKREHAPCTVHMTHELWPKLAECLAGYELQYSMRLDIVYLETVSERTGNGEERGTIKLNQTRNANSQRTHHRADRGEVV
jgi:hypothetical protein